MMISIEMMNQLADFFDDISLKAQSFKQQLNNLDENQTISVPPKGNRNSNKDRIEPKLHSNKLTAYHESGKPKRPMSTFLLYLFDRKVALLKSMSHRDVLKTCGEEWSKMDEKQRRPYLERYHKQQSEYRKALQIHRDKEDPRAVLRTKKIIRKEKKGVDQFDDMLEKIYLDFQQQ